MIRDRPNRPHVAPPHAEAETRTTKHLLRLLNSGHRPWLPPPFCSEHATETLELRPSTLLKFLIAQSIPFLKPRAVLWNNVAYFNMLRQMRDGQLGCIIRNSYFARYRCDNIPQIVTPLLVTHFG